MGKTQQGALVVPEEAKPTIAYIEWHDSVVFHDAMAWKPFGWIKQLAKSIAMTKHITVGLVLDETEEYILITHSIRVDGQCTASISIPKKAILEMRALEPDDGEVLFSRKDAEAPSSE
jgi:hypothetical protein